MSAPEPNPARDPDSAVITLADEIMANHAESIRMEKDAEAAGTNDGAFLRTVIGPRVRACWDMRVRLAQMRATTLAGFRAKARVVQEFNNCEPGCAEPDNADAMAWSLANDLLGVESVWVTNDDEENAA